VFWNLTSLCVTFAVALRGSTWQKQRPQAFLVAVARPAVAKKQWPGYCAARTSRSISSGCNCEQFVSGQNVER
jgi:hypothetical protein